VNALVRKIADRDVDPASDLARRVCDGSPLIASVVVTAEPDGRVAHVRLDPLLVNARAGQQGLPDSSVSAAAADPRVQRLVADAIAQANAGRAPAAQIVRHVLASG